jgi:hypothetical protein
VDHVDYGLMGLTSQSLETARHSGGTCHPYLPGQRVCQARSKQQAEPSLLLLLLVSCLVYFEPEDGGNMLLQSISVSLN